MRAWTGQAQIPAVPAEGSSTDKKQGRALPVAEPGENRLQRFGQGLHLLGLYVADSERIVPSSQRTIKDDQIDVVVCRRLRLDEGHLLMDSEIEIFCSISVAWEVLVPAVLGHDLRCCRRRGGEKSTNDRAF